jgi:hypothetical protein
MTMVSNKEDDAPSELKLSALGRAIFDFELMLDGQNHSAFFRNIETLQGLSDEQKRLTKTINVLYLFTFAGSCFILLEPTLKNAEFSFMGIEASVSIVPQQIIALVTAIAYSMFATHFASLMLLMQMIGKILQREGHEAWHFFAARFNATNLWAALITPRTIGYRSPKRHWLAAIGIPLVSVLSVFAHSVVVTTATALATWTAWNSGPWYLIVFAVFSTMITGVSIISLILLVGLRMPFRLDEMKKAE